MRSSSREAAAYVLRRWLATREFPAGLLPSGPERAFVQDLVYTAIRYLRPLRLALGELMSRWPKGEMEALLYVGAAQVLYMDDVPDFAAVSETVRAAHRCAKPNVPRVVNGVLRNLVRRRDEIASRIASSPPEVRESFPGALYGRWRDRYGEDGAERLAKWFNEPAETFLARRDGTFEPLARGVRVEDAPGFAEGDFVVQDPATAIAVRLLDPKAGERVLDACAAPGGKCAQAAWRGADVTACEVNPARRRRLVENLSRLKLQAKVVPSLDIQGTFRKVLVDAPCSNTGVIRRRPDARWGWSAEKMAALVRLQAEILDRCAGLVEMGGTLVYSTCSLEPEENSAQAESFLARHPEFEAAASEESLPTETGHDGAFAASFVRR